MGEALNIYGESLSVAAAANATVVSYTVPASKEFILKRVDFSSTVKSEYVVEVNSATISKKRIYCTTFNGEFIFENLTYSAGDVISLIATNKAPLAGNINANLQGNLKDA